MSVFPVCLFYFDFIFWLNSACTEWAGHAGERFCLVIVENGFVLNMHVSV